MTSTKIILKSRITGIRETVLTLGSVVALAMLVVALQERFPWGGDPTQLLLIGALCGAFSLLSGWFFSLRGRILGERDDRLVGAAFVVLSSYFWFRLATALARIPAREMIPLLITAWIGCHFIAGTIFLWVAAKDLTRDRPVSRWVFFGGGILLALVAGTALGRVQELMLGARLIRPRSAALAVIFLAPGMGLLLASLRSNHRRDLWLGSALLLIAAAHADISWHVQVYDTPFMWGHVLLGIGFTFPLVGAMRENLILLGEQVALNRRVRRLGRRLQTLLESLPILVLTAEGDGTVSYANRSAGELFGIPSGPTESAGDRSWLDRIPVEEREPLLERIAIIAAGELPSWSGTLTVDSGGGAIHWLQVEVHAFDDPVEDRVFVEIVGSDVTDLLLVRRAAEQRQERLALLSDVAQLVAGEPEAGRILERFVRRIGGWIPVIGTCLYRPVDGGEELKAVLRTGEHPDLWPSSIRDAGHPSVRAVREALPISEAEAVPLPDGRTVHRLHIPLVSAGQTLGVLSLLVEQPLRPGHEEINLLTQLGVLLGGAIQLASLIEELEEQRGIALQASRMKSQFLANTSHELRTPLTSILGFLRLVLDGAVTDPAKEEEFLRIAHQSAERLLDIINDVLDLAKIEAGRLEIRPEPVRISEAVGEVRRLFEQQMVSKNLEFVVDLPPDELVIRADPQRLLQVLTNLLSNALKFTPERGRIEMRAERGTDHVVIEVRDSGPGIPVDELEKVFESFHQVDGSASRTAGGTGLGLTISRRLARMMGGDLTLESEGPGYGTTARLTLPLDPAAAGN